jgi:hypothetical protein
LRCAQKDSRLMYLSSNFFKPSFLDGGSLVLNSYSDEACGTLVNFDLHSSQCSVTGSGDVYDKYSIGGCSATDPYHEFVAPTAVKT